jgi:recombination protein RecT
MAKRTVIRRLCKRFLNTSDDANMFVVESYNRTTSDEYDNDNDFVDTQDELYEQVDAKANSEELTIEGDYEVVEETVTKNLVTEDEPQGIVEEDLPDFA